ncbi:MAG: murein hydrolase activator EnvC family protein [Bdellovibrionales bacterium]
MFLLALLLNGAHAQTISDPAGGVIDKIQTTRASISEDERRQREALSHLFVINKKVKDMAGKQERLNQKLLSQEATVRSLAQEVQSLETRADLHKGMLNKRLRQLYQERDRDDFHWLFSAQSPVELERNHRFLRRMIDSDHHQLKIYLAALHDLQKKRGELKEMVTRLAGLQKQAQAQEAELAQEMRAKSKFIADLKKSKDIKLSELKGLRSKNGDVSNALGYAFFERKGIMRAPVDLPVAREYGTFVDPLFHFRLTHKGLFFSAAKSTEVRSVYMGRVVFANKMPGYGKTVIVDHGDNYYSVYAFASQLKVREGSKVQEGDVVAVSGQTSPLFGPGLYFEIRHFTDAIDPRSWIKDSVIKTAEK